MKKSVLGLFLFLTFFGFTGHPQSKISIISSLENFKSKVVYNKLQSFIDPNDLSVSESENLSEHKNSEGTSDKFFFEGLDVKTAILISLIASLISLIISISLLAGHLMRRKENVARREENAKPIKYERVPHPDDIKQHQSHAPKDNSTSNDSAQDVFSNPINSAPYRIEQISNIMTNTPAIEEYRDVFVTDYSESLGPGLYTIEDFQTTLQNNSYFRINFNPDLTYGRIHINNDIKVNFDPLLNNTDRLLSVCEFIPDPSKAYVSLKEIAPGEIIKESGNYRVKNKIKIKLIEG